MKIALVVDDEPLICCKVAELLQNYGFDQILEAENGQEAVLLAVAHKPVLIVMDVTMPVMNGITAAKKIGIEAPAPIVLLTANADSETVSKAREAGVMNYLWPQQRCVIKCKNSKTPLKHENWSIRPKGY